MARLILIAAALALAGAASAEPQQGRASVRCRVSAQGALSQCKVLSETPSGANVGAFALKLVQASRVPPNDRRIKDGWITVNLRFKLP